MRSSKLSKSASRSNLPPLRLRKYLRKPISLFKVYATMCWVRFNRYPSGNVPEPWTTTMAHLNSITEHSTTSIATLEATSNTTPPTRQHLPSQCPEKGLKSHHEEELNHMVAITTRLTICPSKSPLHSRRTRNPRTLTAKSFNGASICSKKAIRSNELRKQTWSYLYA